MSQVRLTFNVQKKNIEKLKKCPVCKSKKIVIISKLYLKGFNFLNNSFCKKCSLIFKSTRPNLSWFINNFKKRDIYQKKLKINPIILNTEKIRTLRYQKICNFLKKFVNKKTDRLLDVGTGTGLGLVPFKKILMPEGLEPDNSRSRIGKKIGLKIHNQALEKFNSKKKYKFITMIHSLEHLHNISDNIKRLKNFLEDDGYLYLEVPDLNFKKFGWSENLYLGHIYNFCETSLLNFGYLNNLVPHFRFYPDLINNGYSIAILFKKTKQPKKRLLNAISFSLVKKKFFPTKYLNKKFIKFLVPEINDLSFCFKNSSIIKSNVLKNFKQKKYTFKNKIIINQKIEKQKSTKEFFNFNKMKKKTNQIKYSAY